MATHSEHQREMMMKNPRPNKTVAQPSAAAGQNLSGMMSSAKSKGDASTSGPLRSPKGGSTPAADPAGQKYGA